MLHRRTRRFAGSRYGIPPAIALVRGVAAQQTAPSMDAASRPPVRGARGMMDSAEARATPSAEIKAGRPDGRGRTETTLFSVADPEGNAFTLTTTLDAWCGSAMMADGTGILLNEEIDDIALAPGSPNPFGRADGGEAHAVAGGKRSLSSIGPTVVERPGDGPGPFLMMGSPGGPTIITTVLQILLDPGDHGMTVQEPVDARRFHHLWLPGRIDFEARAFPDDVARPLLTRGHRLHEREPIGNAAVIGLDDGSWRGPADPRDEATAGGW